MDIKIDMVRAFGWSLNEVNQTDIVDLLRFVNRLTSGTKSSQDSGSQKTYCDDVTWL